MSRNMVNFLIDAASAAVMAAMIATGLILRFVLPPGSGTHRLLWGWGRHDWGDLHFWMAMAAGAVVVLHVALHWQWVCVTFLRCIPRGATAKGVPSLARRNLSGAALILALVGVFSGFVWSAALSMKDVGPTGLGPGARHGSAPSSDRSDDALRGSMTLAEIAEARGLPVATVRSRLGLPADVPATARLGPLSKTHGFTMAQARQRLAQPQASGRH
jgi:hypothetical protein